MTIEISQFYDQKELKQWKWNKTRDFSMGLIQFWCHIFYQKIKYFNDFQNKIFSWLKWTQAMPMKQNKTFFHEKFSYLTSFLIGLKIIKCFNDFYNWHFCKNEPKQVKWNEIKLDICKSDSIFPYLKAVHYSIDFWNVFLDKVYLKNE